MTPIGVTGASGFLGWHLRCHLHVRGRDFVVADRSTFSDARQLDDFVATCSTIVHLAGVNRADDEQAVWSGNTEPADQLASSIERSGRSVDVVYANSVKADQPGEYGESKARVAEILSSAAQASGGRFVDVRLPHVYGEFGRPHYNSGVTTFAHQLVRGQPSTVNDGQLELLHAQDAAGVLLDAVGEQHGAMLRPKGKNISVRDCYSVMRTMVESYCEHGTVPRLDFEDGAFELRLFNTIRSQMWPSMYPMSLVKRADHRGAFFEVVRASGQGQTSISTTVPGVTRGEHFHLDKIERFAVITGSAIIRVRKLFSREVVAFEVDGETPVYIDMPPLCTHDITNAGDSELVTLFWSHDHFDPEHTDTYFLPVVGEDLPA